MNEDPEARRALSQLMAYLLTVAEESDGFETCSSGEAAEACRIGYPVSGIGITLGAQHCADQSSDGGPWLTQVPDTGYRDTGYAGREPGLSDERPISMRLVVR